MKDLSMRYREDLPCVLKQVNLVIRAGEKVRLSFDISTASSCCIYASLFPRLESLGAQERASLPCWGLSFECLI
jgi:hypothetical protein